MKKIDFSAFNDSDFIKIKVPVLNRLSTYLPRRYQSNATLGLVIVVFLLFFPAMLLIFVIVSVIFIANPLVGLLVFAWLMTFIFVVQRRQKRRAQRREAILKQFAIDNGWEYGPAKYLTEGLPFKRFFDAVATPRHMVAYAVKGVIDAHYFELRVTMHDEAVDRFKTTYPAMVIESKRQLPQAVLVQRDGGEGSKFLEQAGLDYDEAQRVDLEGDFNDYFQLYVPKGMHVEAMSLVAPDFMETVKCFVEKFTIELTGNNIILAPDYQEVSEEIFREFFKASRAILTETRY